MSSNEKYLSIEGNGIPPALGAGPKGVAGSSPVRQNKCKLCEKEIEERKQFCSRKCQLQYTNLYPKIEKFYCKYCKKEFETSTRHQKAHLKACKTRYEKLNTLHICEKCKKQFLRKEGISENFCSRKCSNSRTYTEEQKRHISEGVNNFNKTLGKCRKDLPKRFCKNCGKEINFNGKTGFCRSCIRKVPETLELRKNAAKKGYQTAINKGTFKGWMTRNLDSYAEKFWIQVLNNNGIQYQREKKEGNYFIDFFIQKENKKIALEIDGKQHKYQDRIKSDKKKDIYLKSCGYEVFRIDWNEINSEDGSTLMKTKINSFLKFYSSIL